MGLFSPDIRTRWIVIECEPKTETVLAATHPPHEPRRAPPIRPPLAGHANGAPSNSDREVLSETVRRGLALRCRGTVNAGNPSRCCMGGPTLPRAGRRSVLPP